jgi:tetratricopeptide (TPR) repeat protein
MRNALKSLLPCACALMLVLASARTGAGDADVLPPGPIVAEAREAWLHGTDEAALARIEMLAGDPRVSQQLRRWYSGMQAWLLLEQGQADEAAAILTEAALKATDVRVTTNAVRVLLTFGHVRHALTLVQAVREQQPHSRAARRVYAGLLWLDGRPDDAIEVYVGLIVQSRRDARLALYPYIRHGTRNWAMGDANWPTEELAFVITEPFSSLFAPLHWYPSDLPGLDRVLHALAQDEAAVAEHTARLDASLDAARAANERQVQVRTADEATRLAANRDAHEASARASITARVVLQAMLDQGRAEAADALAGRVLEVVQDDIPILDLQAQALATLGRSEDARRGPLARLRTRTGLRTPRTPDATLDRIYGGALKLLQVNREAGERQFRALMQEFPTADGTSVEGLTEATVGRWLFERGERGLAREYLRQTSMGFGADHAGQLTAQAAVAELLLAELELEADEEDRVIRGVLPLEAPPLAHQAARAGRLAAAAADPRRVMSRVAGVDVWGGSYVADAILESGQADPAMLARTRRLLYELPEHLAAELDAADLEALLHPDSAYSRSVRDAVDGFATVAREYRTSSNWRLRQRILNDAEPALGLIETRAVLLQANLIQSPPTDLEDLGLRLARQVPMLHLQQQTQYYPRDARATVSDARRDAGVPDVPHRGLLLACARILVRQGRADEAAKLIWHNRDAEMGLVSWVGLMAYCAELAGRDSTIGALARLHAASGAGRGSSHRQMVLEFPLMAAAFKEHGDSDAARAFARDFLLPHTDAAGMAVLESDDAGLAAWYATQPEAATARSLAATYFEVSVSTSRTGRIADSLFLLRRADGGDLPARRLAAWALVSDFSATQSLGHAMPEEVADIWRLMLEMPGGPERDVLGPILEHCAG